MRPHQSHRARPAFGWLRFFRPRCRSSHISPYDLSGASSVHTSLVGYSGTVQRVSSYALLTEDAKILLCRLSPSISPRGEWTLPGGGIEFGEHPEDAVIREVFEETGLKIRLTALAEVDSIVFNVTDGRMHAIRFIYRARIKGGKLTPEANGTTDNCAWFTWDEARCLPLVTLAKLGVDLAFPNQRRLRY